MSVAATMKAFSFVAKLSARRAAMAYKKRGRCSLTYFHRQTMIASVKKAIQISFRVNLLK
jgi:hypothetical protein